MDEVSTPGFDDITRAAGRLRGRARRTPLLEARSNPAGRNGGGRLLVKLENLQIGGAFKFRGAYNRLTQLDEASRRRGVIAWSSGNHAQGVAAAGALLGVPSTIVMPKDAPRIKIDNTRRLGAQIVFYDRQGESREAIAQRLAEERGATLVPSYDDPDVIAGQGTVGLELAEQSIELAGQPPDVVVVPCGGGGLIAGCALALERLSPSTRVYAAEPAGFDDTARSLQSGKPESAAAGAVTVCDALMAPTPGRLTFPINRRLLAGGVSVNDEMVFTAMRYAWEELKVVIEPGGAVALAAVLERLVDCDGQVAAVVLSGGNVDADLYRRVLA